MQLYYYSTAFIPHLTEEDFPPVELKSGCIEMSTTFQHRSSKKKMRAKGYGINKKESY